MGSKPVASSLRRPRDPLTERILDAGLALAEEHEGAWTLADVARAAGTARGTVYKRFGTRDALVEALSSERGLRRSVPAVVPMRERILDALQELIRSDGVAHVTIEAAARSAGVGEATVYRHFGGRKGLLQAWVDERTPRAVLLELELNDDAEFPQSLITLASAIADFLVRHGDLVRLRLSGDPETKRLLGGLRAIERSGRVLTREYFARQVDAGRLHGDPALLAHAFLGLLAGVVLADPQRATEDADTVVRHATELFLRGCTAPTSDGAR